ncbi:MAG TPA: glycosyltransferase family 4 protein [Candidatus Rifleibacterium sp.]|nr:glycosyltransferase family 4 protein [Candidatus Rifleibacterium sp.]HPT47304.1 glycosyltransferase family 4 protein [Candidatus Rifleibacterium sp.]
MKNLTENGQNNKKNLLFFVSEDWYYEMHFQQFGEAAVKDGWRVYLVCNTGQKGPEIAKRLVASGVDVTPVQFSRTGITPWLDIKAILKIFSLVNRIKPDVIHAVAQKPILICHVISLLARIPLIAMITGLGHVFTANSLKARFLKPLVTAGMRSVAKNPLSRFVVLNVEDAEWICQNFRAAPDKVITIPGTGVDLKRFFPPIRRPELPFKVAYVGRMLKDKGIIELIEAVKILRQKEVELQLLLAGAPDPSNPASITLEQLQAWQREGLCNFVGHIFAIEEFYRQIHLLALPSYREGLGMTIIEAAASEVPSVASDVPGCRSAVINGETGILVPAKDPQALADAIERLIRQPELREKMGRRARTMVEDTFAVDLATRLIIDQYNHILHKF